MNHYMFDTGNVYANRVLGPSDGFSYQLSLIKEVDILPPIIDPNLPAANQYVAGTSYKGGDVVSNKGANYEYISDAVSPWCSSDAAWAYEPGVGDAWTKAWNKLEGSLTPDPVDPTPPVAPIEGVWDSSSTYTAGDKVNYNGKVWNAQWWTKGEEPGTTGEWGVWR